MWNAQLDKMTILKESMYLKIVKTGIFLHKALKSVYNFYPSSFENFQSLKGLTNAITTLKVRL